MSALIKTTMRHTDSALVAALVGELDASNARGLEEALRGELVNSAQGMVLDLTDVSYMDSAGIQLVLTLRDGLFRRGQGLQLVLREDSFVYEVLEVSAVFRVVPAHASQEEALAALAEATD